MKIEKVINEKHELLSEGDLVLAKYILNHKNIIYDMSINELAEKSLSSKSSVLRFAQKLGYSELKNFMFKFNKQWILFIDCFSQHY